MKGSTLHVTDLNAWHKKWSGLQMKNVFNEKKKPEKIFTQSRLDLLRLEGTWCEKTRQATRQSTMTLGMSDFY